MKAETMKTIEWQNTGGKLVIPDGHFVCGANFDTEPPYITICDEKTNKDTTLQIPKSLAYYLSTHFCGSECMRETIRENVRQEIAQTVKSALGL